MSIRFVDLFAGIGGFHLAMKRAAKELKLGTIECVCASEIDEHAKIVYEYNYKIKNEDIKNIRLIDKLPDHDILFAGFPCQTFSNAGKKMGFLDKVRGTLFFEIVRLLKDAKPKYFILENVKHLIKHDDGVTFKTILETIAELGYKTTEEPVVLSPVQIGIPQSRERVYILGVREDLLDYDFVAMPELKMQKKITIDEIIDDEYDEQYILNDEKVVKALRAWGEFAKKIKRTPGRTIPPIWFDEMTVRKSKRSAMLIDISDWRAKYLKDMWKIYDDNKEYIDDWALRYNVNEFAKREKKFEWQAGIDEKDIRNTIIQLRQSGIRCKKKKNFQTLVAIVQIPLVYVREKKHWRYLTTHEVGKLQSFDDGHFTNYVDLLHQYDRNKLFQTYRQFGNSVNVEVVKQLIKFIFSKYDTK
jgi:DNA (cytosine-5)-methyltransferase 1